MVDLLPKPSTRKRTRSPEFGRVDKLDRSTSVLDQRYNNEHANPGKWRVIPRLVNAANEPARRAKAERAESFLRATVADDALEMW